MEISPIKSQRDYRKILKELQANRVRAKITEKVERNICEPLDLAINQEFLHADESIAAFQKTLDKEKKGDIDLRPALLSYLVSNLIQDGFAATAAGATNPIGSVTAAIADAQLTAIGVTCA